MVNRWKHQEGTFLTRRGEGPRRMVPIKLGEVVEGFETPGPLPDGMRPETDEEWRDRLKLALRRVLA